MFLLPPWNDDKKGKGQEVSLGNFNVDKWCGVGDPATKSEAGQVGLEDSQTNRILRKLGGDSVSRRRNGQLHRVQCG